VWAPIGADVAQVDDMFGAQTVDKGIEALSFDAADGQHQRLYPRRRDGQEGVERHYHTAVIPACGFRGDDSSARKGA
jgi:hypothetical protein